MFHLFLDLKNSLPRSPKLSPQSSALQADPNTGLFTEGWHIARAFRSRHRDELETLIQPFGSNLDNSEYFHPKLRIQVLLESCSKIRINSSHMTQIESIFK